MEGCRAIPAQVTQQEAIMTPNPRLGEQAVTCFSLPNDCGHTQTKSKVVIYT